MMKSNPFPFQHVLLSDVTDLLSQGDNLISLMDVVGFFLCEEGTVDVSLNDQVYHVQKGDLYFYTPSTYVSILHRSDDLRGQMFKCQVDFVLLMLERLVSGRNILHLMDHPCVSLKPEQQHRIEELANSLVEHMRLYGEATVSESEESFSAQVLYRLVMSLGGVLVDELIYVYSCNQSLTPVAKDSKDRIFQSFLISLFKNHKREREVMYYAAEQNLSARYFSSVIKERSGHSALQWIINIVISDVKQLLENSDMSIKELSMMFNFPTQSFFGKYFKQYVGMSPKEYRQRKRGGSMSKD